MKGINSYLFNGQWTTEKNERKYRHMANIHQDGVSIENMQVLSSNCVHSTHSCEANEYGIFKPFFCLSDKRRLMHNIK